MVKSEKILEDYIYRMIDQEMEEWTLIFLNAHYSILIKWEAYFINVKLNACSFMKII